MSKFAELRKIDVSQYVEKKGRFNYLSWAWAVDQLLQQDEKATWQFREPTIYPDNTMMVWCDINAFGKTMTSYLPVMNNINKAIKNPDAMAVNTAMQRCLAKGIGLLGIGLYIYAGEDLPQVEAEELRKPLTSDQVDNLCQLLEATDTDYDQFINHFKIVSLSEMTAGQYQNALSILEKKMQKLAEERQAEATSESN